MSWPVASDFTAIVKNPRLAFREPRLQSCQVETNDLQLPRTWSGQFAVVFKGIEHDGRPVAIRAFTSASTERRERYEQVSRHLRARDVPCLTHFEYFDVGIRSAGDGKWYPLLMMDWVEGMTLFDYARSRALANKRPSLAKAARHWLALVRELEQSQIVHGDLQPANVLVTRQGRLKLVDYDCVAVPALFGKRNLEIGVRPYQHRERTPDTCLAPTLDRFSAIVIYVALRALSAEPGMWKEYVEKDGRDRLLFSVQDFDEPQESKLLGDLQASRDREVRWLGKRLAEIAGRGLDHVPSLSALCAKLTTISRRASTPLRADKPGAAPAAASRPQVILEVTSGPLQGKTFTFDRHDTFLVGRGTLCQARLRGDGKVSRHHFLLEVNPPDVRIRDLGSRNGTRINGVKHGGRKAGEDPYQAAQREGTEVDVRDGDEITIGQTTIRVRVVQAAEDGPPRCVRCGQDVSHEIRSVRRGDYTCQACQAKKLSLPTPSAGEQRRAPRSRFLRIPGYELRSTLGRGKLGTVYDAVRAGDGTSVAIKIAFSQTPTTKAEAEVVLRQVTRLRDLRHANVATLYDAGMIENAFFFVTERCSGPGLLDWAESHAGKPSLRETGRLLSQCLDALEHAHGHDLLHLDLKPENVLLNRQAGQLVVKLTDTGVAHSFERAGLAGMSATGRQTLSCQFLPRERLTGFANARPASDLWSLAAVFYFVLAGDYPLEFRGRDPLEVILNDSPTPIRVRNQAIPETIAAVLDRALCPDLDQRYRTAREMRTDWEQALSILTRLR